MDKVFILLMLFQIKHFLVDYPFQTEYMLGKFRSGYKWILPLFTHALIHALATLWIVLVYNGIKLALELALIDLVIYFTMDRIKASPDLLGRFKALSAREMRVIKKGPSIASQIVPFEEALRSNKYFWWSLGLDQMVHHLTHYYIIWRMVTHT